MQKLSFTGEDYEGERGLVDGLLELFQGKSGEQVAAIEWREVESFLREANHRQVLEDDLKPWMAIKEHFLRALRMAASPIVCSCFKVSYKTIEDALVAKPDLPALVGQLKVSSSCGHCLRVGRGKRFAYLEDIYHGVVAKIKRNYYQSDEYQRLHRAGYSSLGDGQGGDALALNLDQGEFQGMGLLKKIRLVTMVLDKKVRPFLQRDGGDVELVDIVGRHVFVAYQGQCNQCPSSSGGTLQLMTEALAEELREPRLQVVVP